MNTFLQLITVALVVSAVALLWRVFSREDFMKKRIARWPYLLRKPAQCGVCAIFWLSLAASIIYQPVINWAMPWPLFSRWMVLGMTAVFIYYFFLTFYESSHYFAHRAESFHQQVDHNKHE